MELFDPRSMGLRDILRFNFVSVDKKNSWPKRAGTAMSGSQMSENLMVWTGDLLGSNCDHYIVGS